MAEDEMVSKHHQLNGHEFEQLWEIVKDREAYSWGCKRAGHDLAT